MGDFSLIPSFIVFAIVIVALVVGLAYLRRRARRRIAPEISRAPARMQVEDLVRDANIQLVQMDDAIRSGEEELQFALAEFGEPSTHEFADAIATAKQRASEAFALKQKLDDAYTDTEQQQRDWSKRILSLSDSALALVTSQSRAFERRRRLETSAPDILRRVRDDVAAGRDRLPSTAATLAGLRETYAPEALSAVSGNETTAADAFDEAERAADEAMRELESNALTPVTKLVQQSETAVRRGAALLDAVDRMRDSLAAAQASTDAAVKAAGAQIAEATRLRDSIEDPDAVAEIVAASAELDSVAKAAATRSPAHPVAGLDALSAATGALDELLAVARSSQQRLDSARAALVGAIEIAASHIDTASSYISGRRGLVGPDARTRLAAAERELALARLESDPIAALDGARRSATLATDADALARYDASGPLHN